RAPRRLPPLPPSNRANPTAGANSGLDKTWGQGHLRRCDLQLADVPSHLQEFVDRHAVQDIRQLTLRLV
ncbi:hypothetical protein CT676_24480, partial [Bradyrhizobium sp. MOS001]